MPKRIEVGTVTSDKAPKSRRVEIPRLVKHKKYGKYLRRRTVCHVHDEKEESHAGDTVEIVSENIDAGERCQGAPRNCCGRAASAISRRKKPVPRRLAARAVRRRAARVRCDLVYRLRTNTPLSP